MKIIKVRNYPDPKYPVKEMALEDRSVLDIFPVRWTGRAFVVLTAGILLGLSLSGCSFRTDGVPVALPVPSESLSGVLLENNYEPAEYNGPQVINKAKSLAKRYSAQVDENLRHMDMKARILDFLGWLKSEYMI